MAIATGRMTLEKFLELPETKPASEYIEGEIIQKPLRLSIDFSIFAQPTTAIVRR